MNIHGMIVRTTLFLTVALSPVYFAQNLLRNSSFEVQEERRALPEHWGCINNIGATQRLERTIVRDGKVAIRTTLAEAPVKKGVAHWIQSGLKSVMDTVPEGTQLELSAYAYPVGAPCSVRIFFESPSAHLNAERYFHGLKPGQWNHLVVRFAKKQGDFRSSHVCLQLLNKGDIVFDCVYLGEAGKSPFAAPANAAAGAAAPVPPSRAVVEPYCRLLGQNAGSRFPVSHFPAIGTLEAVLPASTLSVSLREIDGPVIRQWVFEGLPRMERTRVRLDLPALAESAYELKYISGSLMDSDCFRVGTVPQRGAYLDEDGYPVVDGKRIFPIGISVPPGNADAFRVYRQSGMNLFFSELPIFEETYDYLSELAEKFDLYWFSWNSWGFQRRTPGALREELLSKRAMYQRHPRLMGFLSDEPMWQGIPIASIRLAYQALMRYLPEYIIYLNHAPRLTGAPGEERHSAASGRRFSRAADLSSVDIYPFPEGHGHNNLTNRTLSCVGEYTDIGRSFTWGVRPLWMTLQAGGWSEEGGRPLNAAQPRPGRKEMRFMAWNAITHGAKGIIWYGRGCRDVYSEWWLQLAEVSWELAAMGELMLASPPKPLTGLPPHVAGIAGKGYRVVVNESKQPVQVDGAVLGGQEVRITTEKPLALPALKRFSPQPVQFSRDYGFGAVKLMQAQWVCHPEYRSGPPRAFLVKQSVSLPQRPGQATISLSVDDEAEVRLNGKLLGKGDSHRLVQTFDCGDVLQAGENLLELEVQNGGGPTGVVFELEVDGKVVLVSGAGSRTGLSAQGPFVPAHVIAPHGKGIWGAPLLRRKMR